MNSRLTIVVPSLKQMVFDLECPHNSTISGVLNHILFVIAGQSINHQFPIFVDQQLHQLTNSAQLVKDQGMYFVKIEPEQYTGILMRKINEKKMIEAAELDKQNHQIKKNASSETKPNTEKAISSNKQIKNNNQENNENKQPNIQQLQPLSRKLIYNEPQNKVNPELSHNNSKQAAININQQKYHKNEQQNQQISKTVEPVSTACCQLI